MAKGTAKRNQKKTPRTQNGSQVITRTIRIPQVLGSTTASTQSVHPLTFPELKQVVGYFNEIKCLRSTLKYNSLCGSETQGAIYMGLGSSSTDAHEFHDLSSNPDAQLSWIASTGKVFAARNNGSTSIAYKDRNWFNCAEYGDGTLSVINDGYIPYAFIGTVGTPADGLLGHIEWVITFEVRGVQQTPSLTTNKILGTPQTREEADDPVEQ